jgi:ABC-type sugar transport system substrate-binding protein
MKLRRWIRHPRGLAVVVSIAIVPSVAACGSGSSTSDTGTAASTAGAATTGASTTTAPKPDAAAIKAAGFSTYDELAPPNFTPPTTKKHVALLLADSSPRNQSIQAGFEDAAKQDNVDLTVYNAGGYQNVAKQVSQMETAIGQKPDAIVVVPVSPVALNTPIANATKAGIVVTAQLIPPSSKDVRFSIVDPLPLDGQLAVEALAKAIGDQGEIYGIFGGAGGAPNTLFVQGALEALKKHPNIKLVYRKDFPSFAEADAQQAAENGLAAHPDVKGILTNGTQLVQGANKALQASGKGAVPGVGIGPSDKNEIQALRDGSIAVAVTTPFYRSSQLSLEWTLAILGGQTPKEPVIAAPPMVFTKDNIDAALSSGALFEALAPQALGCGPGQSEDC